MQIIAAIIGVVLVALTLWDVFVVMVLTRRPSRGLQFTRILTYIFRWVGIDGLNPRAARLTCAMARHAAVDLGQVLGDPEQKLTTDRLPPAELARLRSPLRAHGRCTAGRRGGGRREIE